MLIRDARDGEFPEIGELRVAAYVADGFLRPDSGYAPHLRALGADGSGHVLVALTGGAGSGEANPAGASPGAGADVAAGRIIGTVMLQPWPDGGEVVKAPGEAEVRALAVAPDARGAGVGRALVAAVIERASHQNVRHLVLLSQAEMKPAHHLYEDAGFIRLPERDWEPEPGVTLLAYGKVLGG
jgi:ribosomal protein S18 acetylase RimI-like enzyme